MRLPLCLFLGLLSVGALTLVPSAQTQENKTPEKAVKGEEHTQSKLFRQFDPKYLTTAAQPHFARIDGSSYIGDHVQFGASPDIYKVCTIQGTISDEKLKELFTALKAEVHKIIKASSVEKVGEPSDKVEDRPIRVLRAMYRDHAIRTMSVRGFFVTYTDGKAVGAIDVIAVLDSDALDHWHVACAVHVRP